MLVSGTTLGGGYSYILAIRVCAAGKGMVFKPFTLEQGLIIMGKWSRIASRLMIYLMFKTALSWINMEDNKYLVNLVCSRVGN